MKNMEHFPQEFKKSILFSFYVLQKCNFRFFDDDIPFFRRYWDFIIKSLSVVAQHISLTLYIKQAIKSDVKISELAFLTSTFLITLQGYIKGVIIIPRKADIQNLITYIGTAWRMDNLNDFQVEKKKQLLKKLNICLKIYYGGSVLAIYQNLMSPFFITIFNKVVLSQESDFLLPFGSVYVPNNWLSYLLLYFIQVYSMNGVAYWYIGSEFLLITLCALLGTEFALLREDLIHVTQAKNQIEMSHIENFIRDQQTLIKLTDMLNSIFNRVVFINILFSSAIICLFAFAATVGQTMLDQINNFIALVALSLPIYIICYYGELIKEESAGIADSAYKNLWYRGSVKYQKTIYMIIIRSQRPCCLTSMNYSPVTLNTFTKVASSTWSYFSLALSMYSKH